MKNWKEETRTLVGLLIGQAALGVFISILLGLISGDITWFTGGLLGTAVAAGLICHMYRTIGAALWMPEESAKRYGRKVSFERLLCMGITLAVGALFPKYFHILGILLGLFTIKLGAFLQPLVDKLFFSSKERKEQR